MPFTPSSSPCQDFLSLALLLRKGRWTEKGAGETFNDGHHARYAYAYRLSVSLQESEGGGSQLPEKEVTEVHIARDSM